jgi:hypothetical protein
VFGRSENLWAEQQKLSASDRRDGDRFGNALALGADRALIGAVGKDFSHGAAYVFVRGGTAWTEEQRLVASDGVSLDLFAWSVSLGADRALVGANYADQLRGATYSFSIGLSNGAPCDAHADCASRHCVDERCCDLACMGSCAACAVVTGAAADGTCTIFSAGSEGRPSCDTLICNGESAECALCRSDEDCPEARYCAADGTCQMRRAQGEACDTPEARVCLQAQCRACQSGFCADGVCCDAPCSEPCSACSAKLKGNGDDGQCSPIRAGMDPEDECSDDGIATCQANGHCDGHGGCQRYPNEAGCEPESCTRGDECTSGHCEDGICCDRVCTPSERCRAALKVSGGDGTCGPARSAAVGSACRFGVQCTSGRCEAGVCCEATCDAGGGCDCAATQPARENGCACHAGRAPARASISLGAAAIGMLLARKWRGARRLRGRRLR